MFNSKKNSENPIYTYLIETCGKSQDAKFKSLQHLNNEVKVVYIESICDEKLLNSQIINPSLSTRDADVFEQYLKLIDECNQCTDVSEAVKELCRGAVVILFPDSFYYLPIPKHVNKQVLEASIEKTLQGPRIAFSENIMTNLNLIRHRYHHPGLIVENEEVGGDTNTKIAFLYDTTKVDHTLLESFRKRLQQIKDKKQSVLTAEEMQRLLNNSKRSFFPVFMVTERPDRVVMNLSMGKIVVLVEGNPTAIILPAVFFDFMASMADNYQTYWVGKFLLAMRYIAMFISLVLPGLYVVIVSYNPEIVRIQLALSIAGSRSAVPYPSFFEVLFMLFMMELIVESSIRLPQTISSAATTVGGLILGQAATEAGLISNIMVIVVSAVAISNFVVPISEMSFALRFIKYSILFLATIGGLPGLASGLLIFLVHLSKLESFGRPYFKGFFGEKVPKP